MTQKIVEELADKYAGDLYLSRCKSEEDSIALFDSGDIERAVVAGYNSAQTPNWTKLPELPKDEEFVTQYWITKTNGEVSLAYWNPIDKTFQWTIMGATKITSSNIFAWAKLNKPEPFKGASR